MKRKENILKFWLFAGILPCMCMTLLASFVEPEFLDNSFLTHLFDVLRAMAFFGFNFSVAALVLQLFAPKSERASLIFSDFLEAPLTMKIFAIGWPTTSLLPYGQTILGDKDVASLCLMFSPFVFAAFLLIAFALYTHIHILYVRMEAKEYDMEELQEKYHQLKKKVRKHNKKKPCPQNQTAQQ